MIASTAASPRITISLANAVTELIEAKHVDDLAFGAHHGITLCELEMIMQGGGFVALLRQDSVLVTESQILLRQIDNMSWQLPNNSAFCYGIATHPAFQGKGLGRRLLLAQNEIAITRGAKSMFTTIRVENYTSLKLFMDTGHNVVGYIPFYGQDIKSHRLLLAKDLIPQAVVTEFCSPTLVNIHFGDEVDHDAHERIARMLQDGFKGVSVSKDGVLFART